MPAAPTGAGVGVGVGVGLGVGLALGAGRAELPVTVDQAVFSLLNDEI